MDGLYIVVVRYPVSIGGGRCELYKWYVLEEGCEGYDVVLWY
jgi:hypothetical protein